MNTIILGIRMKMKKMIIVISYKVIKIIMIN